MPNRYLALCVGLMLSSAASGQIYKCPGKGGTDLYQNFPCEIDSIGSVAVSTTPIKGSVGGGDKAASLAPGPITDASSTTKLAGSVPRIGMTTNEVKAIWGEPVNDVQSEIPEGLIEIWSYHGSRSVQFDYKGRVSVVQP